MNNTNQYSGFGINTGILRYQVNSTATDHVFYAGVDSNSSTELCRIKGSGVVGIGTATPSEKLHLNNGNIRVDGSQSPTLRLQSSSSTANGAELLMLQSSGNDGYKMRYNMASNALDFIQFVTSAETSKLWVSTNIGVKTKTPLYDLDINGTVRATSYCNVNYNDLLSKPTYHTVATSGSYTDLTNKPTNLGQFTNDISSFSCNVIFSGTIGIGVASPTATLDVNGSIKCSTISITSSNLVVQSITSGGSLSVGSDNTTATLNIGCPSLSNNTINIGTTSTTSAINIGSATDTLTVNGTSLSLGVSTFTTVAPMITMNSAGNSTSGGSCGFQIYENSNITSYIKTSSDRNSFLLKSPNGNEMSMNLSGNAVNINNGSLYIGGGMVGIGTSTPTQPLEVNGAIRCSAVLTTSDQTLKKNITKLEKSLDKLSKIDSVYFDWKNNIDNKDRHVGVLAQQVQKVLPEAVRDTETGMAVDYNAVLALAISAIKEQQCMIDDLRSRILV